MFFNSVLKALNSESENYMDLRNAGYCFLMENIDFFAGVAYSRNEIIDYARDQMQDKKWASNLIIYSVALLLNITIEIYIPECLRPIIINDGQLTKIFLLNSNNNHFEVLKPIESERKINDELKIENDKLIENELMKKKNIR